MMGTLRENPLRWWALADAPLPYHILAGSGPNASLDRSDPVDLVTIAAVYDLCAQRSVFRVTVV